MKGYKLEDASGIEVGKIEYTVYDAPSDVLKYIVVNGHPIPADRIEVDAEEERVRVPYYREAIESAQPWRIPPASSTGRCVRTTRSAARAGSPEHATRRSGICCLEPSKIVSVHPPPSQYSVHLLATSSKYLQ
jgi:hypothetical protein